MSGSHMIPSHETLWGFDPEDHAAPYHLAEVLRAMPTIRLTALMADIESFERGGTVTEAIGDTLRRAACHADAERIFARLEAA